MPGGVGVGRGPCRLRQYFFPLSKLVIGKAFELEKTKVYAFRSCSEGEKSCLYTTLYICIADSDFRVEQMYNFAFFCVINVQIADTIVEISFRQDPLKAFINREKHVLLFQKPSFCQPITYITHIYIFIYMYIYIIYA